MRCIQNIGLFVLLTASNAQQPRLFKTNNNTNNTNNDNNTNNNNNTYK